MIASEERTTHYYDVRNRRTPYYFSRELAAIIESKRQRGQEIIVLCIGSDRATGDSLGPLIGYKLSQYRSHPYSIYGTLEEPVHAKNLEDTLGKIKKAHKRAFIIAIDASLGAHDHVGYISLRSGALKPGAGVAKDLPAVGNISITGIVGATGVFDQVLLQTTRLNLVMQLADSICLGVRYAFPSDL